MLTKPKMRAAFKLFDKNGNGKICYDELRNCLQGEYPDEFTEETFKELIKKIDLDGDGQINFKEFEKMMKVVMVKN